MALDSERLARRIRSERVRLASHLPPLDPLRLLDADDDEVQQYVAVDVDLGVFEASDGSQRMLVAEGIRERADFTLYVPEWRRMYALANDGDSVLVGDGDPEGEMSWGAMYRRGQLVAAYTEPPADDGLL